MAETTFEFEETLELPLDAVWAAMQRTSELDVMGGQEVVERTSASDWTCALKGTDHTTHCTASYDEASHTVEVTADSTAKHANDTVRISAEAAGDNATVVRIVNVIRGGLIVSGMLKFVGKTGASGASRSILRNIKAIAAGGEGRVMTSDEIEAVAGERLSQLESHLGKHGK